MHIKKLKILTYWSPCSSSILSNLYQYNFNTHFQIDILSQNQRLAHNKRAGELTHKSTLQRCLSQSRQKNVPLKYAWQLSSN